MNNLSDFKQFAASLDEQSSVMPALFIGHGSPMNGIEENEFSLQWEQLGKTLPIPSAVLVISAHWYTRGTYITAMEHPKTIYDFYGFPSELSQVKYPAPGSPELAKETISLVKTTQVEPDHEWGLDHGTWTFVRRMYPSANIPVLQLSIDYSKGPQFHYELAAELKSLRKKGVLIIGSGNMVHNLRMLDWRSPDAGYDWAIEMNEKFKHLIREGDHTNLIHFDRLGQSARLSIPTPEHYLPLLYTLGLQNRNEQPLIFNDKTVMGSVSMTSVKVG